MQNEAFLMQFVHDALSWSSNALSLSDFAQIQDFASHKFQEIRFGLMLHGRISYAQNDARQQTFTKKRGLRGVPEEVGTALLFSPRGFPSLACKLGNHPWLLWIGHGQNLCPKKLTVRLSGPREFIYEIGFSS